MNRVKMLSVMACAAVSMMIGMGVTVAEVPRVISYQGTLYAEDGQTHKPMAEVAVRVNVEVLQSKTAEENLWSQECLLKTDDKGQFDLMVGSNSDDSLADALTRAGDGGAWVQLTVLDSSTTRPFKPMHLASVPHAFMAARADRVLEGLTVYGNLTVPGTATLARVSAGSSTNHMTVNKIDYQQLNTTQTKSLQTISASEDEVSIRMSNLVFDAEVAVGGNMRILGMDQEDLTVEQTNCWYQTKTDCLLWAHAAEPASTSVIFPLYIYVSDVPVVTNMAAEAIFTTDTTSTKFIVNSGDQYPVPVPKGYYFNIICRHYFTPGSTNGGIQYSSYKYNTESNQFMINGPNMFDEDSCFYGSRLVPFGRVH